MTIGTTTFDNFVLRMQKRIDSETKRKRERRGQGKRIISDFYLLTEHSNPLSLSFIRIGDEPDKICHQFDGGTSLD